MQKAQSPEIADVDWPTDLSPRGEALWDLFEAQRTTFHCEAVTATGGGATRRCPEDPGHHHKSGEPPEVHDGLQLAFVSLQEIRGRACDSGQPEFLSLR